MKAINLTAIILLISVFTMRAADSDTGGKYLNEKLPEHWNYISDQTIEAPDNLTGWWRVFADSTLNMLVGKGLDTNLTVAEAYHRSMASRAAVGAAQAGWYPSLSLNAGYTRTRVSGRTSSPAVPPSVQSYFNAGLSASWEIDIFGKIAKGVQAKKATYMASKAEWAGSMVSITAQIASQYFQLRAQQQQLAVAKAHLLSQSKVVAIAQARFETTLSSKLDVAQAQETYYSTAATIPQLENSIHQSINALSVLVGIPTDRLTAYLEGDSLSQVLPDPDKLIGIGVPADLLRRRPDVAEAEMEVASLAAQVGISKKDFLPTLTIEGTVGTQAHSLSDLFSSDSFTYSITPTLSWTLFDGFSRKYALEETRQQLKAAVDSYNLTVLTAIEETDNAISTYVESLKYMDALDKVIEANHEALQLSIDRYKNSLSPMSDVVSAQINALTAESDLISAKSSALTALVSLYEALGGGFDINTFSVNQ